MNGPGGDASPKTRRTPFATREFFLRVISGFALGAVVLAALILGGWPFALVWLAAGAVGAGEWLAMSKTGPYRVLAPATAVALAAFSLTIMLGAPGWLGLGVLAGGLLGLMALAKGGVARRNAAAGLLGGAVIVAVPTVMREDPGIGLVGPAWMFAVVWSTDIVAYFTGRLLGGPKLLPRVSPNKTWSGALGGLGAAVLAGIVTVVLARWGGWSGFEPVSLWIAGAATALASVVSQAGDLLESALKRRYGVKDSGNTIPGHGGVMDRLDGFFAVAVLVGICLIGNAIFSHRLPPV